MSVNLSARQFADANFLPTIRQIIDDSGIDKRFLTFELTESLLLGENDSNIEILRSLKAMGLKLAIDDFGTGYSSLSYLRELNCQQYQGFLFSPPIPGDEIVKLISHKN